MPHTVSLGTAIRDVAVLSGGILTPTGTIKFSLYGPIQYDGVLETELEPIFTDTVVVSGNGSYPSDYYTPICPGLYYWIATYSGDGNNGPVGTAYGEPTEQVMVVTPGCQPLIAGDNGYIVKRIGADNYCVVWKGSDPIDHSVDSENIGFSEPPADPSAKYKLSTMRDFGQVEKILYSQTGGDYWIQGTNLNTLAFPVASSGELSWNVDAIGNIWIVQGSSFYKSTDQGLTFTLQFASPFGSTPIQNVVIDDTYIWWLDNATDTLHRCNLDGTGATSFAAPAGNWLKSMVLGMIAIGAVPPQVTISSVMLITVDNLGVPSFNVVAPFGTDFIGDVRAVSGDILIARTETSPARLTGSIWRSTNGGSSWTRVVGPTPNLAAPIHSNPVQSIAWTEDDVFVAIKVPYVYYSANQGASWTLETVDVGLFDTAPQEWTGIGIGCTPAIITRRRIPMVTLIGAN